LINYIFTPFTVGIIILPEKIGKEKDFQYQEHYEQFDKNYKPQLSAPNRHRPETIVIKPEN
jgi:hypothetical protein